MLTRLRTSRGGDRSELRGFQKQAESSSTYWERPLALKSLHGAIQRLYTHLTSLREEAR